MTEDQTPVEKAPAHPHLQLVPDPETVEVEHEPTPVPEITPKPAAQAEPEPQPQVDGIIDVVSYRCDKTKADGGHVICNCMMSRMRMLEEIVANIPSGLRRKMISDLANRIEVLQNFWAPNAG